MSSQLSLKEVTLAASGEVLWKALASQYLFNCISQITPIAVSPQLVLGVPEFNGDHWDVELLRFKQDVFVVVDQEIDAIANTPLCFAVNSSPRNNVRLQNDEMVATQNLGYTGDAARV